MLYRKFYSYMKEWKQNSNKKALYISGARQIGKTTLIREFGKQEYQAFIEINFITTPSAKQIFEGDLSADLIIARLSAFCQRELIPHHTLIFFDELQECLQVRTAIKFLVEDGRFDYIESGSLLGITYQNVSSFPVGFEDPHIMYPMDFEEFAIALGVQKTTFALLKEAYEHKKPIDSFIHEQMLQIFRFYIVVGGMPAAVQEFVTSKDLGKVLNIQKGIIELYRKDVQKNAIQGKEKIQMIFDAIPAELNNKNKRFILSDLKKSARSERYESCFNWLKDAGVTLPCYNIQEIRQPIAINLSRNLFKLFLNDTGLLCAMSSSNIQFPLIQGELNINEGSIMENMFAMQLTSNGYALYYYDRKKYGEVDFIVEDDRNLLPIEIKSGKDYKTHASLNRIVKDHPEIQKPLVFCVGNVEETSEITYLPLYMIMFLTNHFDLGKVELHITI